MIKAHQKHTKLPRPALGARGRQEVALLGAPCGIIADLAHAIAQALSPEWKTAFADAGHSDAKDVTTGSPAIRFTDKAGFVRMDIPGPVPPYRQHFFFNDADLILLNGNHFPAAQQVVLITPEKPLEARLAQLPDIRLVLLQDAATAIPGYLKPYIDGAPVLQADDIPAIAGFFKEYLNQRIAPLNGLVLAGGKSERMGADKSILPYHGRPQREHVSDLLQPMCRAVFISCNAVQRESIDGPTIEDRFLGLGPMSGILSAFQSAPDAAWLTVACDLPLLSRATLEYLIANRNPSKAATAFFNAEETFPEPLITIWEPRAYPALLLALGEGITCPRKVLIQSDIHLLHAPDPAELQNVNDPASYQQALSGLQPMPSKQPD